VAPVPVSAESVPDSPPAVEVRPVGDDATTLPPPLAVARTDVPEPAAAKGDGPAAAARAALAEKLGRPAPPIEPMTVPDEPVPPPAPPIAAVPDAPAIEPSPAEPALASLRPESPREVVGLAAEHLGIDRDVVVARANELLGPASGSRSPEELARLWQALVDDYDAASASAPAPAPVPEPPPIAAVPDLPPESPVHVDDGPPAAAEREPGPEEIDLDDLVDAPAHTEQFIEKVTEAFPGAELHVPEEPTE
jgi:hypothetical protein